MDLKYRRENSMTDKVQKIREEVEKLHGNPYYMMTVKDVLEILDMQEEPVSIWHDSNEEQPKFASTVAIWNPKYKNGEIISRCTEVYSDRIWANIDDLLKM
jgi:hypothetical protein